MMLENFDPADGIISPWNTDMKLTVDHLPEIAICPFSGRILEAVTKNEKCKQVGEQFSVNQTYPIYIFQDEKGVSVTVTRAEMGAPNCVGSLEELMARGVRRVIIFGPCGVLDKTISAHRIIVPTAAIRDEGTSYHYVPPSDEIMMNPLSVRKMSAAFESAQVDYITGKVWTTDAFYRETRRKTRDRIAAGCRFVDMECSALAAWSAFRHTEVYQFFYTADHVDAESGAWDARRKERAAKSGNLYFDLALRIARNLK